MTPESLYQARPRSRLLQASLVGSMVAVAVSWLVVGSDAAALLSPRSRDNLQRFLGDITPHDAPNGWLVWAGTRIVDHGGDALLSTLALSLAAIGIAAAFAAPAALLAAGNLTTAAPFQTPPRGGWRILRGGVRGLLVLARALPEYLLAFLLLLLIGPGAWPAILALALHNAGILGRLWSEVIEDADPTAPAALWRLGASRGQVALLALLPMVLGRAVLFLLTRWETAVRESTVLGMLGFVSLGWYVADARARMHYDDLALYVALGAGLVLVGDLAGVAVRWWLRGTR
ncbi:MAG: phosphonate transport system permease protein [Myxococcota bacterium]|jgi:phosphonate transport system permease protein